MQNRLNPSSIPDLPHSVTTGTYMRLVIEEWLMSHWWIPALPLAAVIVAAIETGDLRLWVLVPVLVCLLLPFMMVIVYYSYALTPEATAAIRPHLTRVRADGSISLIPQPSTTEEGRRLPELHVPAREIESVEENADHIIVRIKDKPFRFVIIPTKIVSEK